MAIPKSEADPLKPVAPPEKSQEALIVDLVARCETFLDHRLRAGRREVPWADFPKAAGGKLTSESAREVVRRLKEKYAAVGWIIEQDTTFEGGPDGRREVIVWRFL